MILDEFHITLLETWTFIWKRYYPLSVEFMTVQYVYKVLEQRCPTHSPLATCGEWLCFQGYFGLNIRKKWRSFQISFNDHLKTSKQRVMAQNVKFFIWSYKMWRMASFIRHNCGEHKNTVGRCCIRRNLIFYHWKPNLIMASGFRKISWQNFSTNQKL